ncbi:unnamed protein product [Thlaspi arvense]|uniref:MATH domain-containing protein n=1 Tax=Thlaspi arvense TaxID=13288 RepID=A0AAU9SDX9_THLAR|nr:unnamed protein product [Thlaspi arvense]
MEKQYEKKITWAIKNFSSLQSENIHSDYFHVGGCKWRLLAYPKGYNNANHMSLFLSVADPTSLPSGWRRHTKFRLTILNQFSEKLSQSNLKETQHWFDEKSTNWGFPSMFSLSELHLKDSGFLVNGELKIVAEIDVLETIGKLDVTDEASTITETMSVKGFQLLPSQAKSVSYMFERHPDIASEFRPKNPNLRTAYMSLLLSLIETLRQLPQELSVDDLSDAYTGLGFMANVGFKLDWLEKKFDEVSQKKENEEAYETRLQEMEKDLKDLKQKYSDMEALVEKEKSWFPDDEYSLKLIRKDKRDSCLGNFHNVQHAGPTPKVNPNDSHSEFEVVSISIDLLVSNFLDFVRFSRGRLVAFPKGDQVDYLSLYLEVVQAQPFGWRKYVNFRISVVNQLSPELSEQQETQCWIDENATGWGVQDMLHLTKLHDKDGGFMVDGKVMIVAKVQVLEVVGTSEESGDATKPQSKMKRDDDGAKSNDLLNKIQEVVKESIDVNGFQVLPSQVESVRRIFERHPDIAVEFRGKNKHLRTTFMNFLLSLIETLCQPLEELSNEDLVEADIALTYLQDAGFSVGWLEKKLDQLKEKKEKEQSGLASLKDIEQRLHDLMDLCHQKKSEALSIGAPLNQCEILLKIRVRFNMSLVVQDESEEAIQDLEEYNYGPETKGLLMKTQQVMESIDVNGFQVLPYQVRSVSRIFEKHPGIASEIRPKNQHLRSAYMNFLLGLMETLCQPPQELSKGDLGQAHVALVCMMYAGFKVDWLEKKLDQV